MKMFASLKALKNTVMPIFMQEVLQQSYFIRDLSILLNSKLLFNKQIDHVSDHILIYASFTLYFCAFLEWEMNLRLSDATTNGTSTMPRRRSNEVWSDCVRLPILLHVYPYATNRTGFDGEVVEILINYLLSIILNCIR